MVLITGSNENRAWTVWVVENRRPHRQYLKRAAPLPDSRTDTTPWTRLHYASYDNRAFIITMGVDTSTFRAILVAGFGHLWYTLPITRPDAGTRSQSSCEGGIVGCRGRTWPHPPLALGRLTLFRGPRRNTRQNKQRSFVHPDDGFRDKISDPTQWLGS